ncbi:amino acid permease-domain-containing protein [Multifurca ochricompacta]|uniref:Amino acid permease-domain-containing protein n=1 Tax=Multifurca ochricompacta TaxID=376703 RepID=A0AAD4MB00_9AGAM|nr:amino acid permease-domain-containing protein [Multifurca ochricompacta]
MPTNEEKKPSISIGVASVHHRIKELDSIRRADGILLAKLGYKSEFRREFSHAETIAFSFSIMGVIASVASTLSFPLAAGGHVGMIWGWLIPCPFVLCVAASLAELTSAMPWITGWANVTGQVALVCSIDYTCAQMITTAITVGSDGTVVLSSGVTYGILLAILVSHGIVCSASTRILARLNLFYVIINVGTTVAAIITLFVCSKGQRVSARDAFTMFENNTGWSNNGWAFLLAFTSPMWTLTGYDSAAHVSEEVAGAARAAPIAIMIGVGRRSSSVPDLLSSSLPLPMGQLFLDVLGKNGCSQYGFVTGAAQGVDASRVVFAFARDNALPGSQWWKQVNPYTRTPVNAVWLVMFCAALCGLLGFSAAALTSLAGASVVGLYTSYATPVLLRITSGRNTLVPGAFSLGRWFIPIGVVAVAWVAFINVLLLFPSGQHTNAKEMNYAVVIIMAVFIYASLSWAVSARKWFTGPVPNVSREPSLEEKTP